MEQMTEATPKQILVVDDEGSIRMLLVRILRRAGFIPSEAVDGQDAIDQLAEREFDAIVLDLMMPRVDGFGVIDFLIESKPAMMEKTIVVTAFPKTAARERLHHLCSILSKPFEVEELLTRVRECASR